MTGILRPPCKDCGRLYGHLASCPVFTAKQRFDALIEAHGAAYVMALLSETTIYFGNDKETFLKMLKQETNDAGV